MVSSCGAGASVIAMSARQAAVLRVADRCKVGMCQQRFLNPALCLFTKYVDAFWLRQANLPVSGVGFLARDGGLTSRFSISGSSCVGTVCCAVMLGSSLVVGSSGGGAIMGMVAARPKQSDLFIRRQEVEMLTL